MTGLDKCSANNCAYPIAAALPESGTGTIMSASIFVSFASSIPKFFLYSYTDLPFNILSGLEKYIYSNTQGLAFFIGNGFMLLSLLFSI